MADSSGITYQARLPLRWQPAEADPAILEAVRHANLELLQALAMLETVGEKDTDVEPGVAKRMDRLEAKLDLVLMLLSRLASQQVAAMDSVPIVLAASSISWEAETTMPATGTVVRIDLHLSRRLPEPLQFYARVIDSNEGSCSAQFLDADEEFEEWMTRTIFRHHRRMLQTRRQV